MSEENRTEERSEQLQERDILLRRQLVSSFHDEKVHGGFEKIYADIPPELRGVRPPGQSFTLWRILEHLRICVQDFLDYCRTPGYVEPPFPEGYWPVGGAPPNDPAWEESLTVLQSDMAEFERLILNPSTDLFTPIPGSGGRTVLRQALACLDHNAYHLGQAMLLRRLLGIWNV